MVWVTLFVILAGWSGAIIWAAWQTRWAVGGMLGLATALAAILAARTIAGPEPVAYGLALGLSIFLAGVMVMMGLITVAARWLGSRPS